MSCVTFGSNPSTDVCGKFKGACFLPRSLRLLQKPFDEDENMQSTVYLQDTREKTIGPVPCHTVRAENLLAFQSYTRTD